MAYSTSNPPRLLTGTLDGLGGNIWLYRSTDASTVVDASGYFTNGYNLGMRAGDIVWVIDTDASPVVVTLHFVNAASTTAVDLVDATALTTTDSD